jgi:hypothetical protein
MLHVGARVYLKSDPQKATGTVVDIRERDTNQRDRGLLKAAIVAWDTGRTWVYGTGDLRRVSTAEAA